MCYLILTQAEFRLHGGKDILRIQEELEKTEQPYKKHVYGADI